MLYTKFVRTNRSNTHEGTKARIARGTNTHERRGRTHGTAHGRVRTRTRHAHASRRFTHDYARIGTARTAAAHGRRSQVTGRLSRFVISSAARSRRSQSQVAGTRIRHTNTNRTNTGTNRTGRITNRTGAGTNRTDTHTNRTGTGTRTQVAADSHSYRSRRGGQEQEQPRVTREQGQRQGSAQVPARSTQPRAGAGQEQEQEQTYGTGHRSRRGGHDTTRHDTERHGDTTRYRYIRYIRYDTITYDTHETHETGSRSRIRYACERITNLVRYARHAWHSTAARHGRQTDARHTAARIRTVNSQTVSGSHGKRQTVSGICKKRPGGGVNWIHFPFGGAAENVVCNRQLIYI
jgi:hypothetical protein